MLKRLSALCPGCGLDTADPHRSLVGRLLALLVAGAIVVYLIVNVGLWWTSTRLIEDHMEKHAGRWLAELDELGTPLYASNGGKHLANIESRIKHFPEVAYVRYYDASGTKVIGDYGLARAGVAPLTPAQIEALRALLHAERPYLLERGEGSHLRLVAPIRVRAIRSDGLLDFSLENGQPERVQVIGYLDLGLDSAHYREPLTRNMVSGSLAIAAMFLLVLLVGRRLIVRALSPLMALQAPLARLASGETDVRVERPKDREIAVISDALNATISALRERDETLRRMAEHDPLTGLVNRGVFAKELEAEIAHAARDGVESAVFFIDLDQFKYVNDTLGHAAGDRLLRQVADLLAARVRRNDVVSRFGGDEFTILARNVSAEAAAEMARSFNQAMREVRLSEGGRSFSVNCSIGVAMIGADPLSAEEVLSRADTACHEAKMHGRNRFQVYELHDESRKQMMLDIGWFELIKQMIAQDRFTLLFQPIVDVAHPERESYEVLLRMPGQDGERVPPAAFLPVAQRFGLMVEIDRWVVARALKALAQHRTGGREITFFVNLSGQSLEDMSLFELVKDGLESNGLPPACVVFEITEQSAMRHLDKAQRLLEQLVALGCRFALDDFGTGFSSFGYLKELPVEFIKIDGAFVRNMASNAVDETMVASIIQIAHSLGKRTVAEFVSDERSVALLTRSGIDYLQGYYLGEPSESLPLLRLIPEVTKNAG